MIPEELRAAMHETAKMMVHARALLDRAMGGVAVVHPELTHRTIQLRDRLNADYGELAEIIGKLSREQT